MVHTGYKKGLKLGADGFWRYRIVVKGVVATGNILETDYKEASDRLRGIRGDLAKEQAGIKPRKMITLRQAIAVWEADKETECTKRHINQGKAALERHFKPLLDKPLDQIDEEAIGNYLKVYQKAHFDPDRPKRFGGRNQLLTYWRSVKKVMKQKKILTQWDLPRNLKSQRIPKRLIPMEHQEAIMRIIDTQFGMVHGVAFRLGLFLGLRSIEVNRATWRCVDWTRQRWTNFQTKGLESTGLKIPPPLMEALLRLRAEPGGKVDPGDPVCPLANGEQAGINTKIVRHALSIAAKEVMGGHYSSHDLRATFITRLHREGVPIKTIQALARHADISTTLSYIILEESDMDAAMERVYGTKPPVTDPTNTD